MHAKRIALPLFLSLAACAGPRPAHAEGARSGPYSLEVVDEAGRPLPTFDHRGRTYVLGAHGARYLLRIRNGSGVRAEVVASVDGRDVLDGRPAAWGKPGYLVEPHGEVTIDGFRLSQAEVAAFRFSSVAGSYAARMGDARDVGVIGVAVFPEAIRVPVSPPRPLLEERSAAPAASEVEAGAANDARKGLSASGDDGARRERAGLGTGFGEAHASPTVQVAFERASDRPDRVLTLRYDDRRGLLARGIDVDGPRWSVRDERGLRDSAEPFRRGESDCAVPRETWLSR